MALADTITKNTSDKLNWKRNWRYTLRNWHFASVACLLLNQEVMVVGLQNAKSYPREFYLYENSNKYLPQSIFWNDCVAKVVFERFMFQEFCREQKEQIPALLASRKNFRVCFVAVDPWNFDLEESLTCSTMVLPSDNITRSTIIESMISGNSDSIQWNC